MGLIQDNLRLLLLQAVARSSEFYTAAFVSGLEDSSPVRFCYLARQEKTLAGRYSKVLASIRQQSEAGFRVRDAGLTSWTRRSAAAPPREGASQEALISIKIQG